MLEWKIRLLSTISEILDARFSRSSGTSVAIAPMQFSGTVHHVGSFHPWRTEMRIIGMRAMQLPMAWHPNNLCGNFHAKKSGETESVSINAPSTFNAGPGAMHLAPWAMIFVFMGPPVYSHSNGHISANLSDGEVASQPWLGNGDSRWYRYAKDFLWASVIVSATLLVRSLLDRRGGAFAVGTWGQGL